LSSELGELELEMKPKETREPFEDDEEDNQEGDEEEDEEGGNDSATNIEPFFIHIDLRQMGTDKSVANEIHKYMLSRYFYDPRRF